MSDKIELLSPALLDEEREIVTEFAQLARKLRIGLGWHYLLDLAWIVRNLPLERGMTVLDAGAGLGVLQWYLADHGVNVVSVDRIDRASAALRFGNSYRLRGLGAGDVDTQGSALRHDIGHKRIVRDLAGYLQGRYERWLRPKAAGSGGTVTFYRADLADMDLVPGASIDHVVAVSALEHNEPEELPIVATELWRVLRPGGTILATLGASATDDWFHEPSRGWCYTEATLRAVFHLSEKAPSNYSQYIEILAAVRSCAELRDNLARFYFKSGNNGMPWGNWDPKYLSVGVRVTKESGSQAC